MNNNEQVQEYLDDIKDSLLNLYNELDKWMACFEKLIKLINIKFDVSSVRNAINYLKTHTMDVYNYILEIEDSIDEAIARSLLMRLIDIDDALDALIKQTEHVERAGKNAGEGLIPHGMKLKLPTSWKETRSMVGR